MDSTYKNVPASDAREVRSDFTQGGQSELIRYLAHKKQRIPTSSSARLCWELEEPQGLKDP